MLNKNPLNDIYFLNDLFSFNEKEVYVRITALTFNEQPLETIEGKATDGSINIDGSSAVRRTCNLSLVAEDVNINEFYWGLSNKFKLEIGLYNSINNNYPDIIWFKQGIYVITQFNTTQTTNKWTIKIQGKDKMCLLNGDVSGNLPFNVDFGHEEYHNLATNTTTYREIPIKQIIYKAIQELGREQSHNIIIKDIDEAGLELLEYRGLSPLYMFKDTISGEFRQISVKGDLNCFYPLPHELTQEAYASMTDRYKELISVYNYTDKGIYELNVQEAHKQNINIDWYPGMVADDFAIIYDDLLDNQSFEGNKDATLIRFNFIEKYADKRYTVAKIETGGIPGYRLTDLTYGGELKASIGEALTSVLDKIKNKFTNFEYFYDVDGKFVFQKKVDYLSTSWNSEDSANKLLYANASNSDAIFNFIDGKLIASFQNTPKLTNLKNDYSVWGTRDKTTLHMRFAIDNKPTSYLPLRPLIEQTLRIEWENGIKKKEKEVMKYFDAPEIEPYNMAGLQSNNVSYQFLELAYSLPQRDIPIEVYDQFETMLTPWLCDEDIAEWMILFTESDQSAYLYNFNGSFENIKKTFLKLINTVSLYGQYASMSIIPTENGEAWLITYSYFAKYPYGVEDVYNGDELIHYGVDWRELIYQMALDYRKLNYTDDFLYYLTETNPSFINGVTGYEQYYIDLEGFWRQLYDPNPEVLFGEPISYKDIKKESLLLDNNSSNDILDRVYIGNAYQLIQDEDLDTVSVDTLYCYSSPNSKDGQSVKNSIYPYMGSKECSLQKNMVYYVDNTDELGNKIMDRLSWNGSFEEEDLEPYNALNGIQMPRIYVKNDEDFQPRIPHYNIPYNLYQKNVFYIIQNNRYEPATEYDPSLRYYREDRDGNYIPVILEGEFKDIYLKNHYYLYIDNNYVLATEEFNEDLVYYQLDWSSSINYEDNLNTSPDGVEFKTLIYPAVSNLETYSDREVSDYIGYTQQRFDDQKESFVAENKFYIKNALTKKLSECKQDSKLWNLYYNSDIYPLAYYTKDSVAKLDIINSNKIADMYKNNFIAYPEDAFSILSAYVTKLNDKSFENIQQIFFTQLTTLFEDYQRQIIEYMNHYIANLDLQYDENVQAITCLYYQLKYYKKQIQEINSINNNVSIDGQLEKITLMRNIDLNLQNFTNNIHNNYQQVQHIVKQQEIIMSTSTIDEFIVEIDKIITGLTSIKEHYYEGQLQKTLNQLELLRESLTQESSLEDSKERFNEIVEAIKMLNEFIDSLKTLILNTIFTIGQENESEFNNMYILLDQIGNLDLVFDGAVEDINKVKSILFFNDECLIEELSIIKEYDSLMMAQSLLDTYKTTTKNFQEFIIKQNTNNFNYLKDNTLIYEPIVYYKAFYAYNRDSENGNYWLTDIYDNPQLLTFWFDFLEPYSTELMKYSVSAIGQRIKVVNDKDVKAMHYKDIPNIIFTNQSTNQYDTMAGYTYANTTEAFMNLFGISSKSKTAKERIDELLYNHSYCTENINISTIPVYGLEPNNRIYIRDDKCQINGTYLINKITVPLNYKKLMSITALKDVDDII